MLPMRACTHGKRTTPSTSAGPRGPAVLRSLPEGFGTHGVVRRARQANRFTPQQDAELVALQTQSGFGSTQQTAELIMEEVRNFGHYPKDDAGRGASEQQLAIKVRRARQANRFTPQQEAGVLPGGPKKKGC